MRSVAANCAACHSPRAANWHASRYSSQHDYAAATDGGTMQVGVFIPIGNNGWLISENSPQYMPTFDLNKEVTLRAERYGFDFALSMIKLRGFGGKTEFWDHNLESFTLMAGPRRRHDEDQAVRDHGDPRHATGHRGPHGLDHRFHQPRPLRAERHHRLAAAGIFADGAVARRRVFRRGATSILANTSTSCATCGRPDRSDLKGDFFTDGRLSTQPAAAGRDEDHLRRAERRGDRVLGQMGRL